MDRNIQADNAFIKWMEAMSKNVVHIADAWYAAVKWADQHPHWIPVEERLPPRMNEKSRFSDTVLVYNKDGYKDTAYYDFEEMIWRWMPNVTHWMPIVPPKSEE